MKFIRNILRYLALALVLGGAIVLAFEYYRNKNLFGILLSNTIVKGSMSVLRTMGIALLAVIGGLILLIISARISSSIRKVERERNAELKQKEKEMKEENKRLQKEAEEARKEAEEMKTMLEHEKEEVVEEEKGE